MGYFAILPGLYHQGLYRVPSFLNLDWGCNFSSSSHRFSNYLADYFCFQRSNYGNLVHNFCHYCNYLNHVDILSYYYVCPSLMIDSGKLLPHHTSRHFHLFSTIAYHEHRHFFGSISSQKYHVDRLGGVFMKSEIIHYRSPDYLYRGFHDFLYARSFSI